MMVRHDPVADFEAFVKGQQHPAPDDASNSARELQEWLDSLALLYQTVESQLAKYIHSGEIKLSYREIALNEEFVGSYTARQLILRIGRSEITLTPVGTMFFGGKGRVDVEGPGGRAHFMLVDRKAEGLPVFRVIEGAPASDEPDRPVEWAWKIQANTYGLRQYIELTPESLFKVLVEVANG
jgi:hypothetical protein